MAIYPLGIITPTQDVITPFLGLITPSLREMVAIATEMTKRGMKTPLLIGGATTSRYNIFIEY